jgi:phosphoribosylformimino-5-aminoimidazole carboxamide ribotide isomerase
MIEIIPAIDIIGGKCVRLSQGDYNQKREYSASPVDVAKGYADAGCRRLHLVDLDGAKSKHIVNWRVLEAIATATNLIIDFGGGLKSDDDLRIAFDSGAAKVTGGSIAVKNPEIFLKWLSKFGSERIILGADAKDGKIATDGWTESSDNDILTFIGKYVESGITQVISTDISRDGMLTGPSVELYKKILEKLPKLQLIASGGVGGMQDVDALEAINAPAVIVGKAIYENKITLKDLENYNYKSSCSQNA